MTRPLRLLLAVFVVFLCWPRQGLAMAPEVVAGAAAVEAAPKVLRAAKGLAAVPAAIGQTLLLPLGVAETALSPLPVFTMRSGLRNVARGVQGPFKLAGACLKVPLSVLGAAK